MERKGGFQSFLSIEDVVGATKMTFIHTRRLSQKKCLGCKKQHRGYFGSVFRPKPHLRSGILKAGFGKRKEGEGS